MRRARLAKTAAVAGAAALSWLSPVEARAAGADKAGRVMINVKIGPAIALENDARTQFALSPEFAVALDRKYNAYLGLGPQFQFGDYFTLINIPLFFEYDIELPVKGLFLYPKVNAGLSYWAYTWHYSERAFFMLEPVFGVKYQFHKNVHVGGEPIGIPLYLGKVFAAQYHLFAYVGFDF